VLVRRSRATAANVRSLARASLDELADYFDAPPVLIDAIGDNQGTEIQVLFQARRNRIPLMGMLIAVSAGGEAATGVAYDEATRFRRTMPVLMQTAAGRLPTPPQPPAAAPKLQQTMLPDRSGTIGLPPGWQIGGAHEGTVDALGPDGSSLSFGAHGTALTPEAAAQGFNTTGLPPPAEIPVIPFTDPVTAFQAFWEQSPRMIARAIGRTLPAQHVTRVIEHHPQAWPGGQAEMMDVEWVLEDNPPARYRSLVLFGMQPTPMGSWTYYLSLVSAPTERFQQNLPTLLAIWNSWQVAAHVHQRRIDQAIADMREVGQIIDQVHARRQASYDAINADWTEYIRGTTTVRDSVVGEVHDVPLYDIERLVESLNDAAGYERYQHVPLRDLQ
jgi:hypothetical protein